MLIIFKDIVLVIKVSGIIYLGLIVNYKFYFLFFGNYGENLLSIVN